MGRGKKKPQAAAPKKAQETPKQQQPPQKKAKIEEKAPAKEELDEDVLEPVFAEFEAIQDELEKSLKEEGDKVKELGRQYNTKRQPLFNKRSGVIAKIPNFWLQVIMNGPIGPMLNDKDLEIFKYLKDVTVSEALEAEKDKDAADFKVTFVSLSHFSCHLMSSFCPPNNPKSVHLH